MLLSAMLDHKSIHSATAFGTIPIILSVKYYFLEKNTIAVKKFPKITKKTITR